MRAAHCALPVPTINGVEPANPRQQVLIHGIDPRRHRRNLVAQLIVFGH
jgi:hypothetical protein